MSRDTFYYILSKIEPVIVKKHDVEAPIPPDMRLAICIYKLTRGDYNYTIAEMTGVTESTVCQIVIDVCKAIGETLWEESVESNFPESKEEFQEFMITMGSEWHFHMPFAQLMGPIYQLNVLMVERNP